MNGNGAEAIHNSTGTLYSVSGGLNRFGTSGAALDFSGSSSSYVELPDNTYLKPAHALSFSCWIKTPVLIDQYILFTKNSMSSYFEAYNLCIEPGLHFMTRKGGPLGMDMVLSTSTLVANTWYHLVTTIDSTSVNLYVNGVLEATTPASYAGFDYVSGKSVFLGTSNEFSYDAPFNGTMDNIRFYNRVITAAEVSALYTQDPSCTEVIYTSLKSEEATDGLKVFPNPAQDKITIHTENGSSTSFQLLDLIGNVVKQGATGQEGTSTVDLSNLSVGVYFLKTQMNGTEQIRKVIKE